MLIAGVDEVGRGPLVGKVVTAAVIDFSNVQRLLRHKETETQVFGSYSTCKSQSKL